MVIFVSCSVKFDRGYYKRGWRLFKPSLTAPAINRVLAPLRAAPLWPPGCEVPPYLRASGETTISLKTGDKNMTGFYAQPYSLDHTGFYFDSFETFEHGMIE